MARGPSGRIVLEIDTDLKEELYSVLAKDGITLKDWFVQQATNYLKAGPKQLTFKDVLNRQAKKEHPAGPKKT